MLTAAIAMSCLAALISVALGLIAVRLGTPSNDVVEKVNDLLAQTQCGQCGYAGCRPYAEAIAAGTAKINRCPPGGKATIQALGRLLDQIPIELDPGCGAEKPLSVAVITENACIGCAKCLQACPVDAILGAHRYMHTVISDECTGCELCIPSCPVDCIDMTLVA